MAKIVFQAFYGILSALVEKLQWRKTMTRIVLTFMLALTFHSVNADVLLIEEVRQSDRMALPLNGQSKADVEAKYGTPAAKQAAIGDPPISNWKYETYSVYFEYDLVLFTVLHSGAVIEN